MQTLHIRASSISPLLLHNGDLANPYNQYFKLIKEITSKRKKTEDDLNQIGQYEWYGALYYDDVIGPYIPSFVMHACLREGGKLKKRGKDITKAVQIIEDKLPLLYDGPRNIDKLWQTQLFIDARMVCVNQGKILRTRPIFRDWSLKFSIGYNEEIFNESDLISCLQDAGMFAGIGDYTPLFGKFEVNVGW